MLRKLSPALRLALLYLLVSSFWILLSDSLLLKVAGNNIALLQKIQSVKGLMFVVFCSMLLYFVARRYYDRMSDALAKTEEVLHRYKGLGEASKEGIADHDLVSDVAEINGQMRFFMGEAGNSLQHFQLKHRKRIHPEDLDRVVRNYTETLRTDSTIWQADFRYLWYDGQYHDVINRGFIIRDQANMPLRIISAIQDVSELRTMRTAIFRQELKHQLRLGQSIIQTQEQERNRWAVELHDNVCQILTVVKLYLEQVGVEKGSSILLSKAQEMTTKALNDIRQLSVSIRPPEFINTTVQQAVDELLSSVQRVRPYLVQTDFTSFDERRLDEEQKLMIYRVVQEQLSNIIKYAGATNISICVSTEDGDVLLEVKDDGRGFDTAKIAGGIGLKNIRSRLELFSGSLNVETAPGMGCRLQARFALPEHKS